MTINKTKNNTHNNIKNKRKRKMNVRSKNRSLLIFGLIFASGLILDSEAVLAVGNAADAGLTTGVTNLITIMDNKLTPVILIAGCLASLVYSLSIAQPKPF